MGKKSIVIIFTIISLFSVYSVSAETTTITGTILFNGMPIIGFTEKNPAFWVRDEGSKQTFPIDPSYNATTGEYTIPNVPPGQYGIRVTIDDAEPFNTPHNYGFAGDFQGWESPIIVPEGQSVLQKDLDVERTIHLTSPVDNSQEIGSLGAEKDSHDPDDLAFAWDAIPEATSYKVLVYRYEEEPSSYLDNFLSVSMEDTNLQPTLPSSEDNQFYLFKLFAYNANGLMVGKLMVHYDNGHGWDYRFRIVQDPAIPPETTPPPEEPPTTTPAPTTTPPPTTPAPTTTSPPVTTAPPQTTPPPEEPPEITASIDIDPDTLNLDSEGVFTAYITLPEDYVIENIDSSSVECEGVQAIRTSIENELFVAHFSREGLNIGTGDAVKLTVIGKLQDGTYFEGSDKIHIINIPQPVLAPAPELEGLKELVQNQTELLEGQQRALEEQKEELERQKKELEEQKTTLKSIKKVLDRLLRFFSF